jgi:hypothetical protein
MSAFIVAAVVLVVTATLLCLGSLSMAYVTAARFPGVSSLTYRDAAAFRRVVFAMSFVVLTVGVLSVLAPSLEQAWRRLDDQALRVKPLPHPEHQRVAGAHTLEA